MNSDSLPVLPKKRLSLKPNTDDDEPDKLVIVDKKSKGHDEEDDDHCQVKEKVMDEDEEEEDSGDFVLDLSSTVRRRSNDECKYKTHDVVSDWLAE